MLVHAVIFCISKVNGDNWFSRFVPHFNVDIL